MQKPFVFQEKISCGEKISPSDVIDAFGVTKKTILMFLLLSFALFFDGYDNMIVNFSLPSIQAEWNLSSAVTGSLSSWSLIGLMAGGIIAGPLADRFGRKPVAVASIAIFGVLNLPLYFAQNWEFFAVFRVLAGAGLGACIPMVTTFFAEWMPQKNRAIFITSAMAFMVAGGVVAGLVGNTLCDSAVANAVLAGEESLAQTSTITLPFLSNMHFDYWRVGFFIGAFPLLYAVLVAFLIPETPQYYLVKGDKKNSLAQLKQFSISSFGNDNALSNVTPDDLTTIVKPQGNEKSGPQELFFKRYIKGTLAIWIAYFCGCFALYTNNAWMPRLCGSLGYDYTLATVMQGASVLANVFTGIVASKIGLRRNVIVGFAFSGVAVVLTGTAFMMNSPYPLLVVAMIVLGFGINYGQTGLQPLMPAIYPSRIRGTGVAWCQAFGRLGGALGPIALGMILDFTLAAGIDPSVAISASFIFLVIPAALAVLAVATLARRAIIESE